MPRASEDRRLYFWLTQAHQAARKRADAVLLAELDITSVQAGALLFLSATGGCLLSELGEGLGLNNSAVSGLATRLENQGWAARRDDPEDGRAYRLELTAPGKRKAAALPPRIKALQQALCRGFTEAELDVVLRFLRHVAAQSRGEATP